MRVGKPVTALADKKIKLTVSLTSLDTGEALVDVFAVADSYAEAKTLLDSATKIAIETGEYYEP